ncbi:MAG TPA: SRPBCC family protein [Xanthobacteraceae bacterium]
MMTSPTIRPASVRKSITVKADPVRAFEVFTGRIGSWWPRTHCIGSSPQKDVVLEPKVGGRCFEIGEDGAQCNWGKVLAWEPPTRVLLAWQIDGNWKYDPDLITEVEVRFTPLNGGATRVDLEHRNLERFGDKIEPVRTAIDSEGGWSGILKVYAQVAEAAA